MALLQADFLVDINSVYGAGAALSNWHGPLIYLDVPKNDIQTKTAKGWIDGKALKLPTYKA